jgi:hypothetical protein
MTALFALVGLSLASNPAVAAVAARTHFEAGIEARNDSAAARVHFAKAAAFYDELWRHPIHNAALAKNRARAHRLAGNLPASIAALHDGLAVARYDRELQMELEDARAAVEYAHADLAAACRPAALRGIGTRMSPLEAYLIAAGLWFATCFAAARFFMSRVPAWLLVSAACLAGLAVLGGFWWRDSERRSTESARPLIVVSRPSELKTGNGDLWPDRVKWKLPAGVEARELTRRGGWIQIELANGTAGWVPEEAAITSASS